MPGPLPLAEAQRGVAGLEEVGEQADGHGLFSLRGLPSRHPRAGGDPSGLRD